MFGISSANPFWASVHGGPKCHPQAFVPDAKILLHPTPNVDLWKGKADPALLKPDSSTTVPFLNLLKDARDSGKASMLTHCLAVELVTIAVGRAVHL
jgi:hypothetical protein